MRQKKTNVHKLIITCGIVVGIFGIVYMLWEWHKLPHVSFLPGEGPTINKKLQPKMPVTTGEAQQ